MKPPIQVTNELFFKLWNNRILVHENLFALYHPALCLKGSFNLFYVFCCNKSGRFKRTIRTSRCKIFEIYFQFRCTSRSCRITSSHFGDLICRGNQIFFAYCFSFSDLTKIKPTDATMLYQ